MYLIELLLSKGKIGERRKEGVLPEKWDDPYNGTKARPTRLLLYLMLKTIIATARLFLRARAIYSV